MVVTEQNKDGIFISLSPNRSASWQQSKWIIIVMLAVVMIIAIAWTFVGAWVVLPFAGLEIALFAFLMHRVSINTHSVQTIDIQADKIDISYGFRKKRRYLHLYRASLEIYYTTSENDWELPRITFVSGEQKLSIGDFLNLEDRLKLKDVLQDAGFFLCKNKWWED